MPDRPIIPPAPAHIVAELKLLNILPDDRLDGGVWFVHPARGTITWMDAVTWMRQLAAAQLSFASLHQKPAWQSFYAWALISGFALVGFIVLQVMEANADMLPQPWGKWAPLIITPLIPLMTKWFNDHRSEQAAGLIEQQKLMALAIGPQVTPPSAPVPQGAAP